EGQGNLHGSATPLKCRSNDERHERIRRQWLNRNIDRVEVNCAGFKRCLRKSSQAQEHYRGCSRIDRGPQLVTVARVGTYRPPCASDYGKSVIGLWPQLLPQLLATYPHVAPPSSR